MHELLHSCSTRQSFSGAPVLNSSGDVVSVHVSARDDRKNVSVRIGFFEIVSSGFNESADFGRRTKWTKDPDLIAEAYHDFALRGVKYQVASNVDGTKRYKAQAFDTSVDLDKDLEALSWAQIMEDEDDEDYFQSNMEGCSPSRTNRAPSRLPKSQIVGPTAGRMLEKVKLDLDADLGVSHIPLHSSVLKGLKKSPLSSVDKAAVPGRVFREPVPPRRPVKKSLVSRVLDLNRSKTQTDVPHSVVPSTVDETTLTDLLRSGSDDSAQTDDTLDFRVWPPALRRGHSNYSGKPLWVLGNRSRRDLLGHTPSQDTMLVPSDSSVPVTNLLESSSLPPLSRGQRRRRQRSKKAQRSSSQENTVTQTEVPKQSSAPLRSNMTNSLKLSEVARVISTLADLLQPTPSQKCPTPPNKR